MVTFDYKKTPITQVADYIIMYAAKSGASDIHFDPKENGLMVRIRIDGELQNYTLIPKEYERNLTTRLKLLANMNITESRLPQDGAIKRQFGKLFLDMRASSLPTNEGEKIVVRILDYSRSLQGLEHLGFSHTNFLKLKRMIEVPNGIILVTGATGTGKSTTTYSILQALNKPETNIITVEDPIEMNIEGLNQVQVNSEIGLDFATVLRSILRQDPNIILIGEIRDSETAKIAVRASITGHLVLSTIHTNNSLATIERLLDMDVERYLLSSALTGIISQRLAKMICPKCRIEREATSYEKKIFKKFLGKDIEMIFDANHDGCKDCHSGYKGRIAIQEVLEIDNDIRNALNDEDLEREDLSKMVYTSNVITLLQDGLEKVLEGITSFEEIYRIIEIDSDSSENYGAELAKVNKERITKEKQKETSEKVSAEVKKSDAITTKTRKNKEEENQEEKTDEEEKSNISEDKENKKQADELPAKNNEGSVKKEAKQIESIMNHDVSKQEEGISDFIVTVPEVPVFPEVKEPISTLLSTDQEISNSLELEIPSGSTSSSDLENIENNVSENTPSTSENQLNQDPLEVPVGSLDHNSESDQDQSLNSTTTTSALEIPSEKEAEIPTINSNESINITPTNTISFSNNNGEVPTEESNLNSDSNQIEFSTHLETFHNTNEKQSTIEHPELNQEKEITSLESPLENTNQLEPKTIKKEDANTLENIPIENQVDTPLNDLNQDSKTPSNLEPTTINNQEPNHSEPTAINNQEISTLQTTTIDQKIEQPESNLEPSISLLTDLPSNYNENTSTTLDQTPPLVENNSVSYQTLDSIPINSNSNSKLIEQSAPLSPTVTTLDNEKTSN